MAYSIDKRITCHQAQRLVDVYILNDPSLTVVEREAFETHLQSCPKCVQEYEESKWVIEFVKEYWPEKPRNRALLERANHSPKRPMTVKEGWKDLLRRCPDLALAVKRQKRQQLLRRISAVAACLVIGVFAWLAFSVYLRPKATEKLTFRHGAFASKRHVEIELVLENGSVPISAGQEIKTSVNESKTFIINKKHRAVMNSDTTLTLEPLTESNRFGYLVKLASGEIFTNVEHDGNPFVVGTTHGKAVIVGTTFDIKVTEDRTTLVVVEGSVRFKSEKGAVEVKAGQMSTIVGKSAPIEPVPCDVNELTAWATGYENHIILAQTGICLSTCDIPELPLPVISGQTNLESIDYEDWVKKNRDWFKREFPWILQLKDALAKEGIEVDYPELLIQSDDIWQFTYPENFLRQIPIFNLDLLLNATSHYGFDKQWVLKNIPTARFAINNPFIAKDRFIGLGAFEKWIACFEKARESAKQLDTSMLLYSLHASTYLANTRILAWLNVENSALFDRTKDKKVDLLSVLEQQINAADSCRQMIIQRILIPQETCPTKCADAVEQIVANLRVIYCVEKSLLEQKK